MKTEQEQIEAMAGIIAETLQDKRVENGATFVSYLPSLLGSADKEKEVAEELIKVGYGDVSEYKTEIERLKTGTAHFESNMKAVLGIEKKQAQIDILNELKTKTHNYYPSIDSYCTSQHVVLVRDIDELLAEVEND
mgnify:CR=1 FL=1